MSITPTPSTPRPSAAPRAKRPSTTWPAKRSCAERWISRTLSLEPEQAITLYKNNSDGKGNSYGTHENYLVKRDLDFAHVIRAMVPHFVSRQIIVGAGKVGAETEAGARSQSVLPALATF